jgi:hypothetical protein
LYGWTGFGPPWGSNPPANQSFDAQTYVQFGLTDSLTAFGETAFEHYAIGEATPNTYNGLDYSGLGLTQKLWSTGEWIFSGEATVFIPGAHDSKAPAQEGNTGWAGDARLNAGRNFTLGAIPARLRLVSRPRLRSRLPRCGSRLSTPNGRSAGRVARRPDRRVQVHAQDHADAAGFYDGVDAADNRTFPAWRSSTVEASLVYALDDKWSLQLGMFSTVWTVKTNSEHGAALAVWRNF